MKYLKYLIKVLLIIISTTNISFAQNLTNSEGNNENKQIESWGKIKVLTTEKTFWYNCVCAVPDWKWWFKEDEIWDWEACKNNNVAERRYICTVEEWFSWMKGVIRDSIRWIVQISLLLWVIAIAAFGIAWSVAGDWDPEYKKKLKDWIVNLFIWLTILFFFGSILRIVAPWIFV